MGRFPRLHVGPSLLLWVAVLAALRPAAQAARALTGRAMLISVGRSLKADSNGTANGAQECDSSSMLDALNGLRSEHGSPPLSWSDDLAQQALEVVAKQADNPSCQFQFALTSHGESQAKWTNLDCLGAVDLWKGEESKYVASGGGSYVPEAASFTQIIWKATTEVGCAYVMGGCDGSDMGYVSCLYEAPGNWNGGFEENVDMGGSETNSSSISDEQGGADMPGGDMPGGDMPGGDNNGGDNNGGDNNGGDQNGGNMPGGDMQGGDNNQNGGDQNGGNTPGGDMQGGGDNNQQGGGNNGGDQNGGDNNQQGGGNNNNQQPPAGGAGGCDIQATLDAHNQARAKHGAAPLSWDATLAEYALGVVNSQSEVNCGLVHSNGPYGENLAYGTNFNCVDAVNLWMQEEAQWVPGTDHFVSGQGHYTQVVWKGTTSVGCALVPNKCGGFNYIACSYNPPGNMAGGFLDNVQ